MYFDTKPCAECGAEVELRARDGARGGGDPDHEPDATVDERVCTNPGCPTRRGT